MISIIFYLFMIGFYTDKGVHIFPRMLLKIFVIDQ